MCIRETAFLKYLKDYVKDIEAIVMREREERDGERGREEGMKGKSEDEIQTTNKTRKRKVEESGRVLISFKRRVNQ